MLDKWLGLMRGSEVPPHLREIAGMPRDQIEVIRLPYDSGLIGGNGRWFSTLTPQQEPVVVELPNGNRLWQHAGNEAHPQGYHISTVDIEPDGSELPISTSLERGLSNLSHLQLSPRQAREDINEILTRAAKGESFSPDGTWDSDIPFPETLYMRGDIQSSPYAIPTTIPTPLVDAVARRYGFSVNSDGGFDIDSFDGAAEANPTSLIRAETGGDHLGSYVVGMLGGRQVVPHPNDLVKSESNYYYDTMFGDDDLYWDEEEFTSFDEYAESLDNYFDAWTKDTMVTGIYVPKNFGGGLWTPPGALTGKP